MQKLVEQQWDYTKHAKFYSYRPNYAPQTIDMLVTLVANNSHIQGGHPSIQVADIGAGTGNLSLMLLERHCDVVAVEPNDAMREIGIERTQGQKIRWVRATGVDSTLENASFDWVCFGSSFNVMDRTQALKETHRLLKPDCYFSCMWNHRDLSDPIQEIAEKIIMDLVPNYSRGVRRDDQRPILLEHKNLFDHIIYIEEDFYFHQTLENYINAWRSVKNPYWDLETSEGKALFDKITQQFTQKLPSEFQIKYTTRCWSAKKVNP